MQSISVALINNNYGLFAKTKYSSMLSFFFRHHFNEDIKNL